MRQCTTRYLSEQTSPQIQPLLHALCELPNFARLGRVSFLGAIERFAPRENGRSAQSRLQHSIGVADLVLSLNEELHLSDGEFRLSLVHALLHDLGHGPFSHSCEEFFRKRFGIDHHTYLVDTIEDSASEESKVLKHFGLWLDYRNFLRDPSKIPAVQELFFGPINVDTIEGILRASKFFGLTRSVDKSSLLQALTSRPLKLRQLDEFWSLKRVVYNDHIFSAEQARYDALICNVLFFVADEVSIQDFRLDDDTFEERYHRAISHQLNLTNVAANSPESRERNFVIDEQDKPKRGESLQGRYFELKVEKCRSRPMSLAGIKNLRKINLKH